MAPISTAGAHTHRCMSPIWSAACTSERHSRVKLHCLFSLGYSTLGKPSVKGQQRQMRGARGDPWHRRHAPLSQLQLGCEGSGFALCRQEKLGVKPKGSRSGAFSLARTINFLREWPASWLADLTCFRSKLLGGKLRSVGTHKIQHPIAIFLAHCLLTVITFALTWGWPAAGWHGLAHNPRCLWATRHPV